MSSTSSPCLGLLKCSIEMFNCDTTHDLSVVVAIKTESIECYDVSSARCVSVAVEGSLTSRLSRKCARALRAKVKRKCSPSPKRNSSKICLFRVPDVSLPAIVYFAGRNNIWILYFFLIIDNSLPDATFSLFNLSVSDIIDHDMEKYQRNAPVSSMIFGTNALFTKPAQSLAPMMVVHILSWYGYKETLGVNKDKASSGTSPQLLDAMFFLLCLIPLVVAFVQIVFWKLYPLKRPKKTPDTV